MRKGTIFAREARTDKIARLKRGLRDLRMERAYNDREIKRLERELAAATTTRKLTVTEKQAELLEAIA